MIIIFMFYYLYIVREGPENDLGIMIQIGISSSHDQLGRAEKYLGPTQQRASSGGGEVVIKKHIYYFPKYLTTSFWVFLQVVEILISICKQKIFSFF